MFFQKYPEVKVVFALGIPKDPHQQKKLEEEQSIKCDLIQFKHIDNYHNTTLKTAHSVQYFYRNNWDSNHGPPDFLMKGDDDIYINIPQLVKTVKPFLQSNW